MSHLGVVVIQLRGGPPGLVIREDPRVREARSGAFASRTRARSSPPAAVFRSRGKEKPVHQPDARGFKAAGRPTPSFAEESQEDNGTLGPHGLGANRNGFFYVLGSA